ncbi:MAG TPA: His/Gly/Thr/Pro-type tRNA ligase C-terminal domain-containing protein [Candidatus Paceibacterota bacterium]|nr:His/Gly/Thr/Pro-type tRNA ligase C-terminal domain-containing protein [Candidatus Paceibacterota bacterium]
MIRLKDTRYQNTAAFLDSAIDIAEYYGFLPLESIPHLPRGDKKIKVPSTRDSEISFARRDERTLPSAARKCLAAMRPAHGTLLAWRIMENHSSIPDVSLELHVVGASSTTAEVLLIVVAAAIAEEAGIRERVLAINNIGAPDSCGRFVRDVGLYLRKHIESISPTLRPRAAEDPLGTLVQLIERGHPAVSRAPQAMEYLTEEERNRFWELLEYLEVFGLPYELSGQILGSRDCWAHSLFDLSTVDSETGASVPIAFGGRYDPLVSRFAQTPTSAAMVSIGIEARGKTKLAKRPVAAAPLMYFAYLGIEARRRSLGVLETLRRASIPVHQGLWYERIGDQMAAARDLATPYILIMGHKEAMEGTIIVREIATNSQEDVPVPELATYLKRHRIAPWQTTVSA